MTNRQIKTNAKKSIKRILKEIEETAIGRVDAALASGAISEDSDFLKKNDLLAMLVLEDVTTRYVIRSDQYRKETNNIQKFI